MLTNNRSMKRAIAALCVATLACSAVGCGEEKKEAIPTSRMPRISHRWPH